ncbi:MAG TPA: glycosyltransferase [Candidatus Xenobia bacterium]
MTLSTSVIVPVHNGARFIGEAIASIRAQTAVAAEIIVVDDGSDDDTAVQVEALQPGIRVVTQVNRGPAAARNTGWRTAEGDLVAFLDADDTWAPSMLERLQQCLFEDSETDIAQGLIQRLAWHDSRFVRRQQPYQFVNLGSALFRRRVFERVGGFDELLWENEDIDWFLQAWEHGVQKRVLPFVALYYRLHGNNMTRRQHLVAGGVVHLVKRHLERSRAAGVATHARAVGREPWDRYRGGPPADVDGAVQPSDATDVRLAGEWPTSGRPERALALFRGVLARDPGHVGAILGLSRILLHQDRADEAVALLSSAMVDHPNNPEMHKQLVGALVAAGGVARAAAFHGLVRCDAHDRPIQPTDILAVTCVRNEAPRLPFFLDYYRRLGVDRFLMVDNGSTDGTLAALQAEPDVMAWSSAASFNGVNFGSAWFEVLLRMHGIGHWCLIVDADEFLCFTDCETRSLPDLCRSLEADGRQAFTAVLLDMYSDGPVAAAMARPGDDLRTICPFFDRRFCHHQAENAGPYHNQTVYQGGVRERIFGPQGGYLLNKVPLVRYDTGVVLIGGQHWTSVPKAAIATESGALLHMKYLSTFPALAEEQAERGEHYGAAMQYGEYARYLRQHPDLTLFDDHESVRFRGSRQLVDLGIMHAPAPVDPAPIAPSIAPVRVAARPFWSVMVTVCQRFDFLPRALRSVLEAVDADTQVEVVHDGENHAVGDLVHSLAGDRVRFLATPARLGQQAIFNLCLERAQGHWIHLLSDDDWVEAGFYRTLRQGIEQAHDPLAAAFCRHWYSAADGVKLRLSPLERETPGCVPQWLDRIAVSCRTQAAALVVRREVYEAVGGFGVEARSAYDWDMWKRVAAHGPVWFEPTPLAHFCQHPGALSATLQRSGEQIAHAARSIDLSSGWLAPELTREARRYHAQWAIRVAQRSLADGDPAAALANLREAVRLDASIEVQAALLALLRDYRG